MTQLIVFDKDGTLIEPLSGEKFIQSPTDQKILPGAAEAVANFHQRGYKICIASNQGGVEAGYKLIDFAIVECRYALELFPQVDFVLFAPNYKGDVCFQVFRDRTIEIQYPSVSVPVYGGCEIRKSVRDFGSFRKPGAGMINLAIWHYNTLPSQTWMVGDRPEDEQAAEAAGVQFMAADVVRDRYRPGMHVFNIGIEGFELLEPKLKGVYNVRPAN